ncbi:MAG: hypothetical protein ACT4PM_01770 [Gemmatimonadales bacterium]
MKLRVMLVGLIVVLPRLAEAQVGHDPARSPYRTLRYGQFVGVTGGWFGGTGGPLGVAPHGGWTGGIRYDVLANGTVTLGFAGHLADLRRIIIDPERPIETARVDTTPQRTFIAEAIVQFNLTGGKTWNRLAPFVSGSAQFVLGAKPPETDLSEFSFRTKGALAPGIGTRVYFSERLFLRLEARSVFWQVSYPPSFRQAPSTAPNEPPVLAAPAKEWLANAWISAGVSYAFRRPF